MCRSFVMRHHPLLIIGPRAAGIVLIVVGMTAFILLALLSPVPADTTYPGSRHAMTVVAAPQWADAVFGSVPDHAQEAADPGVR